MKISPDIAARADAAAQPPTNPKLVNAAHQFESMLLQEMLKPMRAGQDNLDGDDKDRDSSLDTLSSFGTEAVATAISKGGGLGIARQVIRQVTLEHQRSSEKSGVGTKV